ncbi:MAG: SRPBCC family protein [Bacteriovoracia bacterium]
MKTILFFSLIILSSSLLASADLSPKDLSQLKAGKLIRKVEKLDGEIWPKVTVMAVIPHTPKDNMEVFDDFEAQKEYIPDMVSAKVLNKVEENAYDVAFEMKMPWPISNTKYVTRNIIKKDGENYRIDWHLIKSNQMKDTKGSVIFEALDENQTLLTYVNHITPDSELASMFKSRVPEDVEKTVKVIINHLGKHVKNNN